MGKRDAEDQGRKLYASFISVYSSCLPCRRQEEQEEGRETERLESYTPSNEDLKRENDEDMPVDTAVSQGQAVGKVSENKGSERTHTHTGKCWSMVPVWEGGEGALIVHKATNEKSIGVSLTERRGQKRSAGCPCLCQGMAELAADTQYPLSRTWPGGSTVCTKPRGHSEARRSASWTTCLVSGHGKCFIHQPETHTFT